MQNDFNLVAPVYDLLARLVFGNSIKASQTGLLPFIPENATVLIIGGGTGWILEEVLQKANPAKILYLEASENMLERSRKRYAKSAKKYAVAVEFRLGTEATLAPSETFDVIFTGFLLDLFAPENLQQLLSNLFRHLKPNGLWLLADFYPQNATVWRQKSLLQVMVWFFKLTANLQANQIPDIAKAFSQFPVETLQEHFFYRGLIRSAVYRKV